jgi:hypothetical protein
MLVTNKEYMIFSPEQKATKSGKMFTQFTVSDSQRQTDGTYKNEYYRIQVYDCPPLKDRQNVSFEKFTALNCYTLTSEKNGKLYFNKDVVAILKGQEKEEPKEYDDYLDDDEEEVIIDDVPF